MKTRILVALLAFGITAVGCGDDDEVTPPPTTGDIEVVAVTTGEDIDADGYTVTLDGVDGPSIGANSNVTLPSLAAGTYSVGLDGIADNCDAASNPRNVSVVAGQTATAQFDVTCTGANQRPVADAGQPQTIDDADNSGNEAVTLDGSGSTDDGTIESWSWSLNGVEFGTGETLTVSAHVGVHTVVLTVTDDEGETDTDDVTITVVASGDNVPPVADAGQNQSIEDTDDSGDEEVTLDGSGSTDADGTIESWSWSENSVEIGTGETLNSVFDVGNHTVTLTVMDDGGATDTDDVTITVVAAGNNLPPIALTAGRQTVVDGDGSGDESVLLDGSGSTDVDGMIVSWSWSNNGVEIGTGETLNAVFDVGADTVTLTVMDDGGATDTDDVLVTVLPPTISGVVGFEEAAFGGLPFLMRRDISDLTTVVGPCFEVFDTWDNCISSISVPEGWSAVLFDLAGFAGDSLVVTEDIPDLADVGGADWDNRASSIKIRPPN